jgi:minor extracellular serine protease Vpr
LVGASGEATGVAPGVAFGAYKVFGCDGTTTSEVILQALEAAHRDGMDVVNLSLGHAFQWPGYPTSKAADALVAEGVVVVASIGNSGASGVQSASAPGVATDVIGVASTDNEAARMRAARVAPTGDTIGYNVIGDTAEPEPGSVTDPLVWFGRGCADDDPEGDVEGRAALLTRGGCRFTEKYERAVDAGATAVVIHNDRPGPFGGAGPEDLGPILVAVTAADGKNLRDLAEVGAEPTLEFTGGTVLVDLPFAGLASEFTSYGPTPDLALKPDLAAPGGGIWSTWPVDQGSYRSASGTSMSAPHVAGASALLLEAEPWLTPEGVRTRLANTAVPVAWRGNPGLGYLEAVHRQGTGVIDIVAALDAEGAFGPARVELGDGFGPRTVELEIVSQSKRTTAYAFAHEPAIATTGDIRDTDFNVAAASVAFEPEAVVLAPGERAAVAVTITPGEGLPEGSVFGGRLVAMPANGRPELAAAYVGYHGDYLDRVVLDHDEYPKLAVALDPDEVEEDDEDFRDIADGEVFSLAEGPLPSALLFFAYQPAALEVAFEHLDTGDRVELDRERFLGRSPGPDDTIVFDMESFAEEFPGVFTPGDWVMEVRVLKALGDDANPAHWEEWRSPAFTFVE